MVFRKRLPSSAILFLEIKSTMEQYEIGEMILMAHYTTRCVRKNTYPQRPWIPRVVDQLASEVVMAQPPAHQVLRTRTVNNFIQNVIYIAESCVFVSRHNNTGF